jgi:leucyl aminopeptidase
MICFLFFSFLGFFFFFFCVFAHAIHSDFLFFFRLPLRAKAGVGELDGELRPCSESALRTQRGLGNARPVSDPRGPIAVAAAKAVADAVSAVPEADRAEGCVAVDLSLVMGVLAGADAAADAATLSALLGAVVRKLVLSMHKWDTNITAGGCNAGKRGKRVGEIVLVGTDAGPWTDAAREAAERAYTVAEGIAFARDLNETRAGPGGVLFYAEVAKEVAAASGGALKVEVVDHAALVAMGAGCITAVGQGHPDGAALVLIDYTPVADAPAICLVGKGVVFDTGGLQIKPDPGIRTMYLDMCGAGGVLSAMRVLAKLKPQVNVTGVMCLAENAIGPLAVHPLDIVKSLRGLTVEVTHTDAEGRLCLVDGICFAERNRKVSTLIDIATLTGAQVVALGAHRSALFSYNDALADELTEASRGTCDNIWRMPVGPEHVEAMKSDVADLSNLGKLGRSAGSR